MSIKCFLFGHNYFTFHPFRREKGTKRMTTKLEFICLECNKIIKVTTNSYFNFESDEEKE